MENKETMETLKVIDCKEQPSNPKEACKNIAKRIVKDLDFMEIMWKKNSK